MALTALFLALVGGALLFAPLASAPWLGLSSEPSNADTLQLLGAALASVAMLDWMGRSAIYGGIYGRPITTGNLLLSTYLALGLAQASWGAGSVGGPTPWGGRTASLLFLAVAIGFGGLLFRRPWMRTEAP